MHIRKFSWLLTIFLPFVLSINAAAAGKPTRIPITVNFINEAADSSGLWDDAIRSDFIEAMNIVANDVSPYWRNHRSVIFGSGLKSGTRLIVVDHPLYIGSTQVGGYHSHDSVGAFAIFDLNTAAQSEGAAGPFLFGSHELAEMLADPGTNRFIHGVFVEIADPAVCCHYDLTLSDGNVVPVSDFVLPAWYAPRATGPFDFINSSFIQAPLQYGPGGY